MTPVTAPAGALRPGDFVWLADRLGEPVETELGTVVTSTHPKAYRVTETRSEDGTVFLTLRDSDGDHHTGELWAVQDFHITKGSA